MVVVDVLVDEEKEEVWAGHFVRMSHRFSMSPASGAPIRLPQNHGCVTQLGPLKLRKEHSPVSGLSVPESNTGWTARLGQLPEGGAGASGPMDAGGLGNGTVADVVVAFPSVPVYTTAGQEGVVAGTGQNASAPWLSVTTWTTHSVMVSGACVMVHVPEVTVMRGWSTTVVAPVHGGIFTLHGGEHVNWGWFISQMTGSTQMTSSNWVVQFLPTSRTLICNQSGCTFTLRFSTTGTPSPSMTAMYLAPIVTKFWMRMLAKLPLSNMSAFWHSCVSVQLCT